MAPKRRTWKKKKAVTASTVKRLITKNSSSMDVVRNTSYVSVNGAYSIFRLTPRFDPLNKKIVLRKVLYSFQTDSEGLYRFVIFQAKNSFDSVPYNSNIINSTLPLVGTSNTTRDAVGRVLDINSTLVARQYDQIAHVDPWKGGRQFKIIKDFTVLADANGNGAPQTRYFDLTRHVNRELEMIPIAGQSEAQTQAFYNNSIFVICIAPQDVGVYQNALVTYTV